MSSRQLRKIQQQRELQKLEEGKSEASDGEDDEPVAPAPKPRVSLFAALGGDDDDNDDDDDDDDEDGKKQHDKSDDDNDSRTPAAKQDAEPKAVPQPVKKSKKSKKKKKKGKKKEEEEVPVEENDDDVDEIDRALQELSAAAAQGGAGAGDLAGTSRDVDALLQINEHHLKAIHEMRTLFGKEAIESARQEEQAEQEAELRRQRAQGRVHIGLEQALRGDPRRKLPEISLRRNVFIQGKDNWPMGSAGGLTMKPVREGADGLTTEFAFHHDATYDRSQIIFFQVVGMGDPMMMVSLLQETPYHITTLLQVSKVATQDQNASLAAELIERALFTFGRVTTSAFRQKLAQGRARLDFKRPENREFWLAGYHYIKSLMRKGTFRTAFEWAKLLYSLNPNDPYAMKNFLHPLAIRARQAQWLVDFCGRMTTTTMTTTHATGPADEHLMAQTAVLAHLQLGDDRTALKLAVDGMERVPWLYSALFQALNLDVPPPLWGVSPQGHAKYWTDIYLHMAKVLWNNGQATALLQAAVKRAGRDEAKQLQSADVGPSDLRTARFAFLEGDTKIMAGVPRHLLGQQPNYEFDPLPPPLADNIFSSEGVQLPWRENDGHGGSAALDTPAGREFAMRLQRRMARAQARGAAGGGAAMGLGGVLGGEGEEELDLDAFGAQQGHGFLEGEGEDEDEDEDDDALAQGGQGLAANWHPDEEEGAFRGGVGAFPEDGDYAEDDPSQDDARGIFRRLWDGYLGRAATATARADASTEDDGTADGPDAGGGAGQRP
ncbi:hypothetical protein VD0002_g4727 [Verticillium dahliae]|uniref:Nulp1-pending protein n=2 Tax=Verticillium dahliae TaxID=27337 RepID=A0AA45AMZ2_VERDA|nr:Nulp1-pending protein [Verticillium dahliae]PNH32753.1 hypothetical protein BJF96_g4089 [Verticillium dahliae]PNH57840.1 hypothetical protein VD0003_g84 [Verticillium dahliae]PNH63721.1 hypothetical protein VD0002_g4727 [Verticillium dahliae]